MRILRGERGADFDAHEVVGHRRAAGRVRRRPSPSLGPMTAMSATLAPTARSTCATKSTPTPISLTSRKNIPGNARLRRSYRRPVCAWRVAAAVADEDLGLCHGVSMIPTSDERARTGSPVYGRGGAGDGSLVMAASATPWPATAVTSKRTSSYSTTSPTAGGRPAGRAPARSPTAPRRAPAPRPGRRPPRPPAPCPAPPPGRARRGAIGGAAAVSSMSPTTSSNRSSMVTTPAVPPCSSITTAMLRARAAHRRQHLVERRRVGDVAAAGRASCSSPRAGDDLRAAGP